MPSVISRLYFNRINLSPFGLLCSKYASTACGIPPISIYNRNIRIRFLCIAFPADFLLFKSSLMVSAVISSPTAHKILQNPSDTWISYVLHSESIYPSYSSLSIKVTLFQCIYIFHLPQDT